jgi:alkylation response protein AidB-like acyl-CoA dehydrogenase
MSIALTDDHKALAETVLGFASRHATTASTRAAFDQLARGAMSEQWPALVKQALHSVHIAEEFGGQGAGLDELAVIVEAAGKSLLPGPFLPTVMASAVVNLAADGPVRNRLLAEFAAGATGTVVLPGSGLRGRADGDAVVVSGSSSPILGLPSASIVIAGVELGDEIAWVRIDPAAAGESREVLEGVDLTRDVGRLTADDVTIGPGDRIDGLEAVSARTVVVALMAADAAGVVRWCLDASVEYAKVREQFGQKIGSFQAIKHKAARLFVSYELIAAVAADAIRSLGQSLDQQRIATATAIVVGTGRAVDAAMDAITMHGGIAVTWEHDIHLYWRRAISLAAQTGSVRSARAELGEVALDTKRDFTIEVDDPQFREWVGEILDEALTMPEDVAAGGHLLSLNTVGPRRDFLAAAGLAAAHWPKPWGIDADAGKQVIIAQEFAKREMTPPRIMIGNWAVPTILAHGTSEQIERFAGPTLRGEIMWCQLFSEPEAGSDLASLSTKAEKVDGGWVLNGQKVWTSDAHHAHWAICLARTEPDTPKKHHGLSYFLVDMHAKGVDVRPLKQPNGDSHFNEVFLDDVFVADDQLLGDRGQGWALTLTTLMNERTMISSVMTLGDGDRIRRIIGKGLHTCTRSEAIEALGEVVAETTCVAALNYRESVRQLNGDLFSPGASVVKVASAELSRKAAAVSLDLIGPEASLRYAPADVVTNEMFVPALLIGGGTLEIQLNVIAERILGLPRA